NALNFINNIFSYFIDDANGKMALTHEGVKYYQHLTVEEKNNFLSTLRLDLASLIPTRQDWLEIKESKITESQTFLNLKIKSFNDEKERNVDFIISDLDSLIRQKSYTKISWLNSTNYLDSSYGFQKDGKYDN